MGNFDKGAIDTQHVLAQDIDKYRIKPGLEKELFQVLDKALDVGISVLDADLNYLYMNKYAADTLQLGESDFAVGDSLEKVHQMMVDKDIIDPKVLNHNHLSSTELRDQTAKGVLRSRNLTPLKDGSVHRLVRHQTDTGCTISINHDVTRLLQKEEMLQKALELGKAGYWVYDFQTKKLDLSTSLKAILSPQEMQNLREKGIYAIVHPEDRDAYKNALLDMQVNNDTIDYVGRNRTADKWFRTTGYSERDANGRLLRLRAFVKDITEETLQAQDLQKAKDDAIAANIAKSDFLANMSHEIRTPMNGVLGMAELLADSGITERQHDFVKVISRSSNALLNIINDILDFSKIEAGAFDLDYVAFDLRDILTDVSALLAPKAREKGLELIVHFPPNMVSHFLGDGGRVQQIITNIVGNAVKFTQTGHVVIDANVQKFTESRANITLKITDTGIGIAPESISQIFEKFTQAETGTTRLYGGTGLGLCISKRLAEIMDGDITVSSNLGQGSTFEVTLPLPIDTREQKPQRDCAHLAGLRALIVDDVAINRTVLTERLKFWNMHPIAVQDSVEALVYIKQEAERGTPFDLIILDHLMPGMNGRDLAALLNANVNTRDIPIIMLSSCDQNMTDVELTQSGITAYMVKPIREAQLYDTLSQTVRKLTPHTQTNHTVPNTAKAPSLDMAPIFQTANAQSEAKDMRQSIPILVAEDFPLNQDVVRLMLSESQFAPVFANDGREAVEIFKQDPTHFAAILMDISMPVMDGYEAAALITAYQQELHATQDSQGTLVPIIALTGHALKHDREKCLDANMHDYLTKPVRQEDLMAVLKKWTAIHRPMAASA